MYPVSDNGIKSSLSHDEQIKSLLVNEKLAMASRRVEYWGPQGFWGSGENGYLFSGSWGALVIILGELGSKLIILGI